MPVKEKVFWRDCVVLLILVMVAVGMLGEVSRQPWVSKADKFPEVTDAARIQRAQELTAAMCLEEKVGQMFYGCHVEGTVVDAQRYALGGVMLEQEGFTPWELRTIAAGMPKEIFVSVTVPAFEGLQVVTDMRRSCVQAVRDGGDLIVTAAYKEGIVQVVQAVENGSLPEERVNEAVERILKIKLERGMVE